MHVLDAQYKARKLDESLSTEYRPLARVSQPMRLCSAEEVEARYLSFRGSHNNHYLYEVVRKMKWSNVRMRVATDCVIYD